MDKIKTQEINDKNTILHIFLKRIFKRVTESASLISSDKSFQRKSTVF